MMVVGQWGAHPVGQAAGNYQAREKVSGRL
jgi:hypothetical protein